MSPLLGAPGAMTELRSINREYSQLYSISPNLLYTIEIFSMASKWKDFGSQRKTNGFLSLKKKKKVQVDADYH